MPEPVDGRVQANAIFLVVLASLAGTALAWGVQIVIVRSLAPEDWNALSRFLTLAFAAGILRFGFPNSVLYFASHPDHETSGLWIAARTSLLLAGAGTVAGITLATNSELFGLILGERFTRLWMPLSVAIVCDLAFAPLPQLLTARKHPRIAAGVGFAAWLPANLSVLVAITCGYGVTGIVYAFAGGAVAALLIGWMTVYVVLGSEPEASTACVTLKQQAAFALPLGLTNVVQSGNSNLDKYIVMTVFTQVAYGIYYLGAVEFELPALISHATMSVLMAHLVRLAREGKRDFLGLWHASIEKVAMLTLPSMCFLLAFAPSVFSAVYGETYTAASVPFRILQLALLKRVTDYRMVSLALGNPRVPLVSQTVALATIVILNLILCPTLGFLGPAVAKVAGEYAAALYVISAVKQTLGVHWHEIWPFRRYFKTLIVATIALIPAIFVLVLEADAVSTLAIALPTYILSFVVLARSTSLLGIAELEFLRGLARLEFLQTHSKARSRAGLTGL